VCFCRTKDRSHNLNCRELLYGSSCKGDQIFFRIDSGVTAKLLVVDSRVRHCAAGLTPPARVQSVEAYTGQLDSKTVVGLDRLLNRLLRAPHAIELEQRVAALERAGMETETQDHSGTDQRPGRRNPSLSR